MKKDYWIKKAEKGWAAQKIGASKAAVIVKTQKEAENWARSSLMNSGGGELITTGRDGKIRSKDTINAPDKHPPYDREH
jgi:hypothetical protein